jgi:hypothetical protein
MGNPFVSFGYLTDARPEIAEQRRSLPSNE